MFFESELFCFAQEFFTSSHLQCEAGIDGGITYLSYSLTPPQLLLIVVGQARVVASMVKAYN